MHAGEKTTVFSLRPELVLEIIGFHCKTHTQLFPQAQDVAGMVLEPSCLAKLDSTAVEAARIVKPYGAEVWDGEGADHTGE